MSLFDLLFPDQSTAMQSRRAADELEEQTRLMQKGTDRQFSTELKIRALQNTVNRQQADLDVMSLVVMALFKKLCEVSDLSAVEVQELMKKVDESDGIKDGKIDFQEIRSVFGFPDLRDDEGHAKGARPDPKCQSCGRPIRNQIPKCLYCGGVPQ